MKRSFTLLLFWISVFDVIVGLTLAVGSITGQSSPRVWLVAAMLLVIGVPTAQWFRRQLAAADGTVTS
ncbi:MAG: hypothetical protein ABI054_10665 [Planctomycetota bacterium]